MIRLYLVPFFFLFFAVRIARAGGPCTESAIQQGNLPTADDAFSYMPPYGKPVVGKPAIQSANAKSFSGRTNVTRSWASDHRIVSMASGDMAYEYGVVQMGYDDDGKRTEFEAVILRVYKSKDGVCQIVALTMQPLDDQPEE